MAPWDPAIWRWSNRQVRTIGAFVNPGVQWPDVWPFTKRPDFVEWNRTTNAGDIYELKPGDFINLITAPATAAAWATAQLFGYALLLKTVAPKTSWGFGSTWIAGFTAWPFFPLKNGQLLVTFNLYPVVSGVIFYSILADDTAEIIMAAAEAAAASAYAWLAIASELEAVAAVQNEIFVESKFVANADEVFSETYDAIGTLLG